MATFATTTGLQVKMVGVQFDTATSSLATVCLNDAEAEIKKWLSKRYDLTGEVFTDPSQTPAILTSWCEDLGAGYMWMHMSRGSKEADARAKMIIDRVMKNLAAMKEGEMGLVNDDGDLVPEVSGDWAVQGNTSDYSNTFNEDDPKNWRVDRDKLEDIKDEREE